MTDLDDFLGVPEKNWPTLGYRFPRMLRPAPVGSGGLRSAPVRDVNDIHSEPGSHAAELG